MKNKILYIVALLLMLGCWRVTMADNNELKTIKSIPDEKWQKLSQKKIYFGHQSVGDNIMLGINELMVSNPSIKLQINKTNDPNDFRHPVFAHKDIGNNSDTNSKISAFRDDMQKGIGNRADIAFLKFCFWDIRSSTDIKTVFNGYKSTLAELKSRFPRTKFVHMTIPLMEYPNGVKDRIYRFFNMSNSSDLDNMRRNELNELILNEYRAKEPVFDIAMVESTLPDGKRAFFSKDGKTYYYLARDYTNDGGHLNVEGRKRVAEQLLVFLAEIAEK